METANGTVSQLRDPTQRPNALSCLQFIAERHGLQVPSRFFERATASGDASPTTRDLVAHAQELGLKARPVQTTWRHLLKARRSLPAIVTLDTGKRMVLTDVEESQVKTQAVLIDPAASEQTPLILDRTQLESIWSGQTLLLKRNYDVQDEDQAFGLGLMMALILRERRILRDITVAALVLSALALVPILFFRILTTNVLAHQSMSTFVVLCIALAVAVVFETIFSALRRALTTHLTARIDVKISTYIFNKMLRLPIDFFEKTPVGLIARDLNEVNRIRTFLTTHLLGTALDTLSLLFYIPIMLSFSVMLTILVLASCSVICVWTAIMLPIYGKRYAAVLNAEGVRGSFLIQTLQGIRTVKSLALEERQAQEWDVHVGRIAKLRIRESNLANLVQSTILPLERFMTSGTLAIAVYLAMASRDMSSIAEIFVFLLISARVVAPLRQVSQLLEQYDEARCAVEKVGAIVNLAPEDARSGDMRTPLVGHIEFSDVVFKYAGSKAPALNRAAFEVPAGTTLGIMGRSGSGKTTVTRLLQRLHDDFDGVIKIDGVDIRNYALDHLRSNLGVVLQDSFLFSGTVRENIAAAKPNASFAEITRAARLAGAEEFIERLPRGYDTYINEGSTNLSGGQRQRLAIARALIIDPPVMILDEATSALDPESEAIVNENLSRISAGRTTLVISHRLSSLVSADAILVLERGKVHDLGKHEDLLARCDIYRELWFQQNGRAAAPAHQPMRLVS